MRGDEGHGLSMGTPTVRWWLGNEEKPPKATEEQPGRRRHREGGVPGPRKERVWRRKE